MKVKIKWKLLIVCIIVGFLPALLGIFTNFTDGWYESLAKPWFTPPNWLFGPVWTALYFIVGISLYLVLVKKKKKGTKRDALIFFSIQLIFNAIWTPVFFSLHAIGIAMFIIISLYVASLATIILFYNIEKNASYLLVPYQMWLTIALLLNLGVFVLN